MIVGMEKNLTKISKFLSLILRHRPQTIGLTLDENGWADVEELIEKARVHGRTLNLNLLSDVVANNDKKRFVFSENGTRIRASQGHSIEIDLNLEPVEPQDVLYHGTAQKYLNFIKQHLPQPSQTDSHSSSVISCRDFSFQNSVI